MLKHFYKVRFIAFLITLFLCSGASEFHTGYKKKIAVEPFSNPWGWDFPGNPAKLIFEMLKMDLIKSDHFDLIESETTGQDRQLAYQYLIRGEILKFKPKFLLDDSNIETIGHKNIAEVSLNLSIIHSLSQRTLASKGLASASIVGSLPFHLDENETQLDVMKISGSAMGKALKNLIFQSSEFIDHALVGTPFEAMIISVEPRQVNTVGRKIDGNKMMNEKKIMRMGNKKEVERVMINAGRNHGIKLRDRFNVFSLKPGHTDPITQYSLGERITRIGVVRVITVQDTYSWALVEAGDGFSPKQIIRAY